MMNVYDMDFSEIDMDLQKSENMGL